MSKKQLTEKQLNKIKHASASLFSEIADYLNPLEEDYTNHDDYDEMEQFILIRIARINDVISEWQS
jgi:hypothetical protein